MTFCALMEQIPCLIGMQNSLCAALDLLETTVRNGGKIILCGNGGSAADCEHIVGELMKGFLLSRPLSNEQKEKMERFKTQSPYLQERLQQAIPAISLVSGIALPSAFANDVDAEYIFAQQVFGLGKKGDLLWCISTSGNSPNVIHAMCVAKALELKLLGLTGRDGGAMAALCDVELRAPAETTPGVQELHLPIYHALCAVLEKRLFGEIEARAHCELVERYV